MKRLTFEDCAHTHDELAKLTTEEKLTNYAKILEVRGVTFGNAFSYRGAKTRSGSTLTGHDRISVLKWGYSRRTYCQVEVDGRAFGPKFKMKPGVHEAISECFIMRCDSLRNRI